MAECGKVWQGKTLFERRSMAEVKRFPHGIAYETSALFDVLVAGQAGDEKTDAELSELIGKSTACGGDGYHHLLSAMRMAKRERRIVWKRSRGDSKIVCLDANGTMKLADHGMKAMRKKGRDNLMTLQAASTMSGVTPEMAKQLNAKRACLATVLELTRPKTIKAIEARPDVKPNYKFMLEHLAGGNGKAEGNGAE